MTFSAAFVVAEFITSTFLVYLMTCSYTVEEEFDELVDMFTEKKLYP